MSDHTKGRVTPVFTQQAKSEEGLRGRARCVAPRASADAASDAWSWRALAVGRWRGEIFGRYRCLTLRYSLLLSVWVDPSAEHRDYAYFSSLGVFPMQERSPDLWFRLFMTARHQEECRRAITKKGGYYCIIQNRRNRNKIRVCFSSLGVFPMQERSTDLWFRFL